MGNKLIVKILNFFCLGLPKKQQAAYFLLKFIQVHVNKIKKWI